MRTLVAFFRFFGAGTAGRFLTTVGVGLGAGGRRLRAWGRLDVILGFLVGRGRAARLPRRGFRFPDLPRFSRAI